jgi:DNA-binding IclR family transcriptional regulator
VNVSARKPVFGSGLQTLDRAINVLRALSTGGEAGLRMADVVTLTGLPKPTVHRLLLAMIKYGLISRDLNAPRYRLGQELIVLGWSAMNHEPNLYSEAAHSAVLLARETGDTVFLLARSGFDTVCIGCELGHYPIKALTMAVGDRRPLGFGVSSLSILGRMQPVESDAALTYNLEALERMGISGKKLKLVRQEIERARVQGYAYSVGLFHESVSAVSRAVHNSRGAPQLSIVIGAIEARFPPNRIRILAAMLERECNRIEQVLALNPTRLLA